MRVETSLAGSGYGSVAEWAAALAARVDTAVASGALVEQIAAVAAQPAFAAVAIARTNASALAVRDVAVTTVVTLAPTVQPTHGPAEESGGSGGIAMSDVVMLVAVAVVIGVALGAFAYHKVAAALGADSKAHESKPSVDFRLSEVYQETGGRPGVV